MTVAEMLRRMPALELTEWIEFYRIEADEEAAREARMQQGG